MYIENFNYWDEKQHASAVRFTREFVDKIVKNFNAVEVYVNEHKLYCKNEDMEYTLDNYFEDMEEFSKKEYYPFIMDIVVKVVDFDNSVVYFYIDIQKMNEDFHEEFFTEEK